MEIKFKVDIKTVRKAFALMEITEMVNSKQEIVNN